MRDVLNTIVCENIMRLRVMNGFTQSHVSIVIGIKQPSYNRIEAGVTHVNLFQLHALAKFYQVVIGDFFVRESKFDSKYLIERLERDKLEMTHRLNFTDSENKGFRYRICELERRNIELEAKVSRKDRKIDSLMGVYSKN